jgi:D-alanyl-D-alanine dipeptidase
MSLNLPTASVAFSGTGTAQMAEHLRAYLMNVPPSARSISAASPTVRELPAGLVDVRDVVPGIVVLPPPVWSDPELRFRVHPEVARRLRVAATVLPSDVRLAFWEGLRPLAVQQQLWDTSLIYLRRSYPGLSMTELEDAVELFVARPSGQAPPHSTGSAVDVAPVNAFGQVLSPGDAWGRLGVDVLSRALREAGLANYTPEWWHWSYGDEEWARAYDCTPLSFATTPEFDGPGGGI